MRIRLLVSTTLSLSILALAGSAAPPASEARPIPDWVLANWEQLVGTWIAEDSVDDGIDAYGIDWDWGLGRKSLVGRLYGMKDGREVGTFWEFREFWHPGEGQLIATQYGSDGTYGAGPHVRKDDGTTEMLQTFFDPTTGAVLRVGHRSELKGDEHVTSSFDVSEGDVWTPRRTYVWRRKR